MVNQLPFFVTLPQMMFGVCAVPAAVAGASSSVDVVSRCRQIRWAPVRPGWDADVAPFSQMAGTCR